MLRKLLGDSGSPSESLIRDLRALCCLSAVDVEKIAASIRSLPADLREPRAWDALQEAVMFLGLPSETHAGLVTVTKFLARRWAQRGLTNADVVDDLRSVVTNVEDVAKVIPLLDAIESKLDAFRRAGAESLAVGTGIPQINSAVCSCDARAVFRSTTYDKAEGDAQPYYNLDYFLPIVVLEIMSELNDQRETHTFLLTQNELDQLWDILDRARRRLAVVTAALATVKTSKE